MGQNDVYKTISHTSQGIYKEKGSRFLAFAFPVYSEDEIKNHIKELKQTYYDARHCCYAWQLGLDGNSFRVNDGGEPSGTAGKPIYGQIKSFGLTNILIAVIRYFGGTKLGTSGLINAYRQASIDAINNTTITERTINDYFEFNFPYTNLIDIMKILKDNDLNIVEQQFKAGCVIKISVRKSLSESVISQCEKLDGIDVIFIKTV